jgi:hypothetical protein
LNPILSRSKKVLPVSLDYTKGKLEGKPTVQVLYNRQDDIPWWAHLVTPLSVKKAGAWNSNITTYIHMLATIKV